MIKPDQCHYHFNTCRDSLWAENNCFIDHYVYLSKTSSIKIGITKFKQIPYRWIDQGAVQALPIIKVNSRYQAGLIESMMKNYIIDKTNWKKMIFSNIDDSNLLEKRKYLLNKTLKKINLMNKKLHAKIKILSFSKPIEIEYPLKEKPDLIKSVRLEDNNQISDILIGIKGQYLIFKTCVINMKKILGYELSITFY